MLLDLLLIVVGTAILLGGAWMLLRGATTVALSMGISRVVIGATVVAFGTSAPELIVTITAGLRGATDVAFGNVVGSNIANVFLVLGLTAAISPIAVHQRLLRWEVPVLVVATAITLIFAINGALSRIEGIAMLLGLAAFLVISPRLFPEILEEAGEEVGVVLNQPGIRHTVYAVLFIVGGLVGLAVGAEAIVRSASSLAADVGISEFVVGVLIVALGTSLPEVVTSAMAAINDEPDLAVGNVVGSNIFNLLAVAGAGAVVSGIPVSSSLFQFELPALALSTLVLLPIMWPRYRIGRTAGALLLVSYAAVVVLTLVRG